MSCIVCATRGGEGSRAVQLEAIRRAREMDAQLVFLFVADSFILDDVEEILKPAVRAELDWMGNALLNIAQHRAGVAHIKAELVVRQGDVREEIDRFLKESHANLLLLGAPRGTSANVFGDDAVEQFAQAIGEDTGVKVEIIRPEAVAALRDG